MPAGQVQAWLVEGHPAPRLPGPGPAAGPVDQCIGRQRAGQPLVDERLLVALEHFQAERRPGLEREQARVERLLQRVGIGVVVVFAHDHHVGAGCASGGLVQVDPLAGRAVADHQRAGGGLALVRREHPGRT
jgi:hypothetical protein